MLTVDSHLDLAFNAVEWNRDLTQPIHAIREAEAGMGQKGRGAGVVNYQELRQGRISLFFATVHCRIASLGRRFAGVRTQDIAYAKAWGELAYYRIMESKGVLRQIRNVSELESHLEEWDRDPSFAPLGYVLSMEGSDPIVSPEQVPEWWDQGLRVVSLCHYGVSTYSHGTGAPGGLTPRAPALLRALEEAGMILDISHLAEQAFWEALDQFGSQAVATHNCCQALCEGDRQLNDQQIRALVSRGGVIGVALDGWMLSPRWSGEDQDNSFISLETVVDHMDHICQLAGDARHAAIGSDLDGGYGREQCPHDLHTIADLRKIPAILEKRGYSLEDVTSVMGGNWVRLLRDTWS